MVVQVPSEFPGRQPAGLDRFVDAARVAVIGQSMGGSAVLYAVDRELAAQYNERFRTAIAYYPKLRRHRGMDDRADFGADRRGGRLDSGRALP